MKFNTVSFLLLLVMLFYPVHAGNLELLFEAGSRAYLEGDWEGALSKWKQIESSGNRSGELYYNLGSASFKLGKLGESILYWEKAANLLGEDSDLSANLKIAQARLKDKPDDRIRLEVWNQFDKLRAQFGTGILAWGSVLLCFLLFVSLSVRRWVVRGNSIRKLIHRGAWALTVLLIVSLSLLVLRARDDSMDLNAILMVTEAEILSAPADGTGKLLFTLHEGTKVRILRSLENWYEISAGKDKQGWVKKGALGVI